MAGQASEAVRIAGLYRLALRRNEAEVVQSMVEAWRGVEATLIQEFERFAERLGTAESLTPGQLLRLGRFQSLLGQVQGELIRYEQVISPLSEVGQRMAAEQGQAMAAEILRGLGVSFNRLPMGAVENLVGLARAGQPLAALLEPMYGQAAAGIMRELTTGLALGHGPRAIARRMARDGLSDGLNHLLLVTRDQYNRSHRLAAMQTYRSSGVVTGYVRRCARQAGRTCVACIILDGEFFTLDEMFESHPQCRCTMIPAVRGVNYSTLGSGREWFESLGREEQMATMGGARYEAFQAGDISWEDMVRHTSHPVWGAGVQVASLGG